ncbi:MAG TPA: rhomboid family intramembrane serine protease [Chthoniobacterales bacterium]|nr:rhomboid family intramembrane serine protease [Chthoniobacterales bacterium]
MFGVTTSDDYQPVTWVGRHPVDVTTLLVGVHVALMVLTCFLMALGGGAFLGLLIFDSAQVLALGRVWQIVTYAFVHAPYSAFALFWFAIEMYMLFAFGRQVERFVGRRAFIFLYALLLCVPTLCLLLIGLWGRYGVAGSATLHFGVFIAFAMIYPNVEMFFLRIQLKWIALILIGIGTLAAFANHDWASLILIWTTTATAFVFLQLRGVGPELAWWDRIKSRLQPKPKFQVVPRDTPRRSVEPENIHESIDPVLEKISKHGINSLTASERRALDRARNRLLKNPQ